MADKCIICQQPTNPAYTFTWSDPHNEISASFCRECGSDRAIMDPFAHTMVQALEVLKERNTTRHEQET